jgi:hypothetical protein
VVHAVTNFRAHFDGDDRADCTWYLLLWAADGVPVLPTHPPITISLMTDKMQRTADGRWLCSYRRFETWFQGGTPPTNPKL